MILMPSGSFLPSRLSIFHSVVFLELSAKQVLLSAATKKPALSSSGALQSAGFLTVSQMLKSSAPWYSVPLTTSLTPVTRCGVLGERALLRLLADAGEVVVRRGVSEVLRADVPAARTHVSRENGQKDDGTHYILCTAVPDDRPRCSRPRRGWPVRSAGG